MSTAQLVLYGAMVGGGFALIVVLAGLALRAQFRRPPRDLSDEKDWML